MSVEVMRPRIKRPTNGQGIGIRRLTAGQLELRGLLVRKFGLMLDLNLLVAHLGRHQVLLVVRHVFVPSEETLVAANAANPKENTEMTRSLA